MARAIFVTLVFVVFTAYSLVVTAEHGFFAAFEVAMRGGWNTQEFLDLVISLFFASTWMRRDAREKKLPFWPFAIACVPLGSVGILAYATWSAWRAWRSPRAAVAITA